ncbi:lethal giant larvae like, C-terminal-domain-containing protein [Naematelia encephala]|uniref:Lethal giant larvae like, C-terminal-domain-containing protein n=1 Tax=Naematelia encephala TaxID=71784 RepID=A0A1Y2BJQ4_9TREE|nr:lethal giant larvae like, C-terminal-domain-containing protein [Naematelia encephala]
MFKSKAPVLPPDTDYTKNLRETSFYRYGSLRALGLSGEVTALAVDPVLSLMAVGTSSGMVHCYGNPAFQFSLPVSGPSTGGSAKAIKFLLFHPGQHRIIAVDTSDTLHSYSLQHLTDSPTPLTNPPLPVKEGAYTLWGTVTSVEQPLPSHAHLFLTVKDGTTLAWDLSRRTLSDWKVGNCWGEYEERMIRSGIPGRRKTAGGPMATCLAMNPRDLNILLIGYEGGVVSWNIQKGAVDRTFEMTLPPGAPGGGSYDDKQALWSERTPSVSCITWRPDGLVFAVGHSDGCITLWAYSEPDKPLMVRTITHEDVNVTDADALFSAGALDNQIRAPVAIAQESDRDIEGMPVLIAPPPVISAMTANREPIYKLTWVGFPDQLNLRTMAAAQGTDAAGEQVTNATMEYAERGETLLMILGGQSPEEQPGINILQFPAYQPPLARRAAGPQSPSESMPLHDRYAFRDSLAPTGTSFYPTRTPPEDFVLLPRNSPYFGMAHDPIAIIVSLTPDPNLPLIDLCAERSIEAWVFPPPRSSVAPPSPGRKHFVQPGEGEKLVAMTPAPVMNPAARGASPGLSGWRLPWTTTGSNPSSPVRQPSPTLRVPTPDSISSVLVSAVGSSRAVKRRRKLRLPSPLWSGPLSVLGCEIHSLPTPAFKRLISWSIENADNEPVPRFPVHGGMAVPDLQSHGAPDVKVVKMESYRILLTFHPDATVRFWDISPHLLLVPTPLRFEYPSPLPHLTISLGEYLKHPDIAHLPLAKQWEADRSKVRIKSVHLAREALECVITMISGEVIVTKFAEGKPGGRDDDVEELEEGAYDPKNEYFPQVLSPGPSGSGGKSEWIEEVTEIGHLAKRKEDGFKPVAIFTLKRGEAVSCAVSNIGFIAVAFDSKSVAILDMRGPDVILREGFNEDGLMMKKKKKKGNTQNVLGENSEVGAMKWVVSGMGTDPSPRPRLIVSYAKGTTKIYSLVNVLGEWIVETKPPTFTNESLASPLASFVLDPSTGSELSPTAESLLAALRGPDSPDSKGKGKDTAPHCLWVVASRRSIRISANFNGERVAKVELEEGEALSDCFYVYRHGQRVIVGITETGSALFYTAPFLEYITRMDLYFGHTSRRIGKISMDDRSGDFIEHSSPLDIHLRTLFHFRKPLPPRLDPCAFKRVVGPQPTPLGAVGYVGSWIWGGLPLTGAQLDSLIAGPNRKAPPREPPPPKKPIISWGSPPEEPMKPKPALSLSPSQSTIPKRTAVQKQRSSARVAGEREDVYSQMTNAANERQNYLDDLGEQLNNVTISAGQYLSQAKNTAMKEAVKGTARGIMGKLL